MTNQEAVVMEVTDRADQLRLRQYMGVLWRRKLVLVFTVVLVIAAVVAFGLAETPVYTASASVLVPQQSAGSALNIQDQQLPAAPSLQRSLSDEQQFALGDSVKDAAQHSLGFRASIKVTSSSTADLLKFSASSSNKKLAARTANAYAQAYIQERQATQVRQYTDQITALEASIARLQGQETAAPPGSSERSALQQSIGTLTQTIEQTQAEIELASQVRPTILSAATVPSSPSSPKLVRDLVLGLLVGIILGVGLVVLAERYDDGLNSREVVERVTEGLPIIGAVPLVESWQNKDSHHLAIVEEPNSGIAESYRTLRTAVQFLNVDTTHRVLGFTSSVPNEGKTTTVANLAVSFARAGKAVAVVSCDLRRPRVHEFFRVSNTTGLTSVIVGDTELSEAVVPVPGEPGLRILPSGPIPPNPAELLSNERVQGLIATLAGQSDVVLLDCPPVLPVTDALLLSHLADGMIVIAAAQSTSGRELHRTYEMLKQVQSQCLGTIINRVPLEGRYDYDYRYGGYYAHYQDSGARTSALSRVPMGVSHEAQTQTRSQSPLGHDGRPLDGPPDL